MLAGWTHYIAFDLMMARHVVIDSQSSGIPHLAIVWAIPLTLMAGPAGLFAYYLAKLTRHCCGTKVSVLQLLYLGATFFSLFMVYWVSPFGMSEKNYFVATVLFFITPQPK